jgi:cation diffusion facilitator CzcD-associated flavoprotein CzcO
MVAKKVDVCIVGGGICGILAAHGCIERGLSFELFEKGAQLGGCWQTLANSYSTLQVRPHTIEIFMYPNRSF